MRTYLQKELLIAFEQAQTNLMITRILGSQSLFAKLIIPLGKLAIHCLQLYKFKEVVSLTQLLKHLAHATLVALKHVTLIRVVSTVTQVLTALSTHSEQLRKSIGKLMQAYKKGNYYALGKALAYTTKTLVGRTLAHRLLRTSFKIARSQNLNIQYTKALLHGAKHALYKSITIQKKARYETKIYLMCIFNVQRFTSVS